MESFVDLIVGARPNMMKAAPLVRNLSQTQLKPRLIHTGQHYDESMSEVFLRELRLPKPAHNLGVGSGSHGTQTGKIMEAYETILLDGSMPKGVVVLGDVNSTVACALVAKKLDLPCAHVEAGLRSFDQSMPEEINRLAVDAISDLHFCTELEGALQLAREGHSSNKIHLVGNLMVDNVLAEQDQFSLLNACNTYQYRPKSYIYSTLHRPANVDDLEKLKSIMACLDEIAETAPVLLGVHPRTQSRIEQANIQPKNVRLIPPQPYHHNLSLIHDSIAVISDSGGIQSETTILNIPCLLLRDTTEQPVVVESGTTELLGTDPTLIKSAVDRVCRGEWKSSQPIPYWDGLAGSRIAAVLASKWGD